MTPNSRNCPRLPSIWHIYSRVRRNRCSAVQPLWRQSKELPSLAWITMYNISLLSLWESFDWIWFYRGKKTGLFFFFLWTPFNRTWVLFWPTSKSVLLTILVSKANCAAEYSTKGNVFPKDDWRSRDHRIPFKLKICFPMTTSLCFFTQN